MVLGIVLQRWRVSLCCVGLLAAALCPGMAQAGECPSPQSEIATDRPDVTNSSLVVPDGSIQIENGLNTSGQSAGKGFDGSNSRLRFGVAPCLEVLVDVPSYVGRLTGTVDTGFTNVTPGVKWQVSGLPEPANLSVVFGVGLPTGTPAITGAGFQPYLQFPWSYELGGGWGISGMFTSFFRPSDLANHQTSEATFVIERKVSEKLALFAEYVSDTPSRGASTALLQCRRRLSLEPDRADRLPSGLRPQPEFAGLHHRRRLFLPLGQRHRHGGATVSPDRTPALITTRSSHREL